MNREAVSSRLSSISLIWRVVNVWRRRRRRVKWCKRGLPSTNPSSSWVMWSHCSVRNAKQDNLVSISPTVRVNSLVSSKTHLEAMPTHSWWHVSHQLRPTMKRHLTLSSTPLEHEKSRINRLSTETLKVQWFKLSKIRFEICKPK